MKRIQLSLGSKALMLFALLTLLWAISAAPKVNAMPDPVEVCWYVTDISGTPINGASLTIYWSTSTSGPFTVFPAEDALGNYLLDKVNGVTTDPPGPPKMSGPKQNPIISGYWNPTYTAGMAICDLHPIGGLSGLYFYAQIEYDLVVEYWPTATSIKPGDPSWTPVSASGSPSGFAAAGPGIGTGPTTAYPTHPPPPPVIPEVPLGPVMATVSMMTALVAYVGIRRRKM